MTAIALVLVLLLVGVLWLVMHADAHRTRRQIHRPTVQHHSDFPARSAGDRKGNR